MASTIRTVAYYYRGLVERGIGGSYQWREGWSEDSAEGRPLYPWSTKRECQSDARRQGVRAVFIRDKAKQIA